MLFRPPVPHLLLGSVLVCTSSTGALALEQGAEEALSVQDSTAPKPSADQIPAPESTAASTADPAPQTEQPQQPEQAAMADEQQAKFAKAIAAGTVLQKMSMEQVVQARGEPSQKEVILPDAELWRYAEGEVAFSAGKVTYVSLAPKHRAPTAVPRHSDPVSSPAAREPAPKLGGHPNRVAAPPIAVGDTYVYESKALGKDVSGPGSSLVTRRTVTASGRTVTMSSLVLRSKRAKPRNLYYDREWNLEKSRNTSGSGLDYAPALRYYDFPLYPGKTWHETTTETNTKTGAIRQHTIAGRVEGWETVSVPAGTFRGIKVVLQTELFDPRNGERVSGSDTSWYVPEVRRSVKSLMTGKAGKERLIQLLSYELGRQ